MTSRPGQSIVHRFCVYDKELAAQLFRFEYIRLLDETLHLLQLVLENIDKNFQQEQD